MARCKARSSSSSMMRDETVWARPVRGAAVLRFEAMSNSVPD